MGDFDEYDYLEATLEGPAGNKQTNGEKARADEDKGSKRRIEDEEGKHSRKRSRDAEDIRAARRSRSPSRHRSRDRDRGTDRRERESGRSKSRDRDRERERDRDRDRDRERERDRFKEKERRRSRERRDKPKEEEPEPVADPERDQRTVFAYQISLKADERDVFEFFSRAGKVQDVRLIVDRNSRRHKGVGYIEFADLMSVPMAIALTGQLIKNVPVMVKPSEAEKNLIQPTPANAQANMIGPYSGGARRLYVGNLHFNMTEEQLKQVFEPFGPVELVQLPVDPETSQCKGFGFVQYLRLEDARAAQQHLNGLELAGRPIKVTVAPVSETMGLQDANIGEIDDDDGNGLSLNARSRALLMQKLDRSGVAQTVAALPVTQPYPLIGGVMPGQGMPMAGLPQTVEPVGLPSDNMLLKNMFDPATETEPDFDADIKDDVTEECSKNSKGHVYLRFDTVAACSSAQRALHGRWFAGKMITASFIPTPQYLEKFPDAPR